VNGAAQLLRTVSAKAAAAELPFFVIGGYAVMAHGFIRTTDDLDLLVQASRRVDWQRLVEGMGMTVYQEAPTFLQFNPAPGARLPLDVMFVADDVFGRMQSAVELATVEGVSVGVVSLHHLIALKCHAIKVAETQRGNLRILKDTDDLIHLIQLNAVDLHASAIRDIILKHGTEDLYKKLQRSCAPG
jgi:hypothetical protein